MLVRVEFDRSPAFEMQNGNAPGHRPAWTDAAATWDFLRSRRPPLSAIAPAIVARCDALISFDFDR